MKLIPAISIKHGHVVVVDSGQYRPLKTEDGLYRNPTKMMKERPFEGEQLFVLDIDGIESNKPDLDLIKRLSQHKEIWLDSGSGNIGSVMDTFVSGASRVVVGTKALHSLELLSEAIQLSEGIIFSIDYDKGVVSGFADERYQNIDIMIQEAKARGVQVAMIFDLRGAIDKIPPDLYLASKVGKTFGESYIAGHITKDNIGQLKNTGLTGAIMDFRAMGGMDVH